MYSDSRISSNPNLRAIRKHLNSKCQRFHIWYCLLNYRYLLQSTITLTMQFNWPMQLWPIWSCFKRMGFQSLWQEYSRIGLLNRASGISVRHDFQNWHGNTKAILIANQFCWITKCRLDWRPRRSNCRIRRGLGRTNHRHSDIYFIERSSLAATSHLDKLRLKRSFSRQRWNYPGGNIWRRSN